MHLKIETKYLSESEVKKCEDMDRARQFALTLAAQIVDFLFYIFSDFFFPLVQFKFSILFSFVLLLS